MHGAGAARENRRPRTMAQAAFLTRLMFSEAFSEQDADKVFAFLNAPRCTGFFVQCVDRSGTGAGWNGIGIIRPVRSGCIADCAFCGYF